MTGRVSTIQPGTGMPNAQLMEWTWGRIPNGLNAEQWGDFVKFKFRSV